MVFVVVTDSSNYKTSLAGRGVTTSVLNRKVIQMSSICDHQKRPKPFIDLRVGRGFNWDRFEKLSYVTN